MKIRIKRKYPFAAAFFCLILFLIFMLFDRIIFPLPIENLRKPVSLFIYSRNNHLMRSFLSPDGYWRKPVSLQEISPLLRKSVLAREDRWFYYHPGFNPLSLFEAAVDNVKARKVIRGGSTITMQIARMMEPKERTFGSKLIEIIRAVQLEAHYSKDELLGIYFNIAPYGGNIEGVGAAAYFYFNKAPSELTPSQAALLTSIPNSPNTLRPDRNFANCLEKRNRVLRTMLIEGVIDSTEYSEALDETIVTSKTEPPTWAPHFTTDLAQRYPNRGIIRSTLDLKTQQICEGIVNRNIPGLKSRGIYNAAVVVIDNATAEILAMVGSADFYDDYNQGQVNGATAPRSPGSALKPFVYAMAIEEGLVSPKTILIDLPVYYSGYSPENYDRKYRGAVTVSDALEQSLNVPAVNICSRVGVRDFYSLLKSGGISTLYRDYRDYGLPIILGSCEVTLLDLTGLYSSFARGGIYLRPESIMDNPVSDSTRLFTQETSYIISEILSGLKRPDFPSCWEFSRDIPKVAWKTGTSYGRKDAWSIGYNTEFTIGVWTGNFDAESSPYLVGAEAAAPILFDIFQALSEGYETRWFDCPAGISHRLVCQRSGKSPGESCDVTIDEMYIPGVSPVGRCDIHRPILVDDSTGYRLCSFCSAGRQASERIYEEWPPRMMSWLLQSGKIPAIPVHNPECTGTAVCDRPVIISPTGDNAYVIRDHIPLDLQGILLDASVASSTKSVYWFVDGALYGTVDPGKKLFFIPQRGTHKLTCSDDRGRSTSIDITIM